MNRQLVYLLIVFAFFVSRVTVAQETTVAQLSYDLHECLQRNDYEKGWTVYSQLKKKTAGYLGYHRNAFSLYMSVCTDELNIEIGEEEANLFYQMCIKGGYAKNRTKGKILSDMAAVLCDFNQYELALSYYREFLKLEQDIEPLYFYRYLMDMGWTYNRCQLPQKAFLTFKRCASFYKDYYGPLSRNYAKAINSMAYVARYINADYLDLLLEENNILKCSGDTASTKYAICLDNIAAYYYRKKEHKTGILYALKANSIFKQEDSTDVHYAISLNTLGCFYKELCETDSSFIPLAESYLLKSFQIYHSNNTALNLALLYENVLNNQKEARHYFDLIEDYARHHNLAMDMADYYARTGDFCSYATYMKEYIDYVRDANFNNVIFMSSEERKSYINLVQEMKVERLFEWAAKNCHQDLPGLCFDYLLMSKSLLLSYDASINDMVKNASDTQLQNMALTLDVLRFNAKHNTALTSKVDSLEHLFLDKLSEKGNFSNFINLHHTDIQRYLKDGDVVIDFYSSYTSGKIDLYAVVLLSKGYPVVINCYSGKENQEFVHDKKNTMEVLQHIIQYVTGKKRVFFSPYGEFHNYPFESELAQLLPKTKIYRLSSSRELAKTPVSKGSGAAIFGGIDYDLGVELMAEDDRHYRQRTKKVLDDNYEERTKLRQAIGKLQQLPKTLQEALAVDSILAQRYKRQEIDTFFTSKGTEPSFKSLSGRHKRIIHIATHGSFEASEELSLSDSKLYFAGANNKYMGELIPDSIEDGILTAEEISYLNLSGLDLVCLSACQTARGKITPDGVFGLQRGFKKAGAQSILMSLWKVDDEATCLLMTEFYRNWITQKMTKHDALEAAKQTVRSHKEKGWDDPKYWAAFILLDGLD